MDSSNFNNALAKAQKYMLDENWQNQVTFAEKQQSKKMNNNGGGGNDLAALEAQIFGSAVSSPTDGLDNVQYTPQVSQRQQIQEIQMIEEVPRDIRKTKLPQNIQESFMKQPPLSGDAYPSVPSAVDRYLEQTRQNQLPNKQMVAEQYVPQSQPMMPQTGGVNYELIKYMINEAIETHMKKLNESTSIAGMAGMRICDGNKIQFLDKKGNLYEGILTLKKRAK